LASIGLGIRRRRLRDRRADEPVSAAPFVIEVGSKAEAECVAEALASFGSALEQDRERWAVVVAQWELDFASLFAALEACLRDNAIPAVRVTVGDRNYVMEPAS
jgi:hypothetical protein